ncbi:MAG TPA: A24 family peptidase [Stellaceae bacterium]|nr:A24 family peptidase [Stellaceae bacterium]
MLGVELLRRMFIDNIPAWSALLAAPFIGSFLGVVVRRLPEGRPIARSRSQCETCGAVLSARDLVPLFSWVAATGRCRFCASPLGWFYPGIELAALAIAMISVFLDTGDFVWLDCVLGWWLLTLAWVDVRYWLLPDVLTLPLIVTGLASSFAFDPSGLADRAFGAVAGYLGLRAIAVTYRAIRGREGLGGGDAKLLAAAGAWVGVRALPQVVLFAALAGLLAAAGLRIAGVRLGAQSALPFGPFLALATWLVWLAPAVMS